MLVLSRKTDETIVLGSNIVLTVVAVQGNRVKIGIKAPNDVRILRGELPDFPSELDGPSESDEPIRAPLETADQDMLHSSATLSIPR